MWLRCSQNPVIYAWFASCKTAAGHQSCMHDMLLKQSHTMPDTPEKEQRYTKEALHAHTGIANRRQTCFLTDRHNRIGQVHGVCSMCAYPDLILGTLAGQNGLVALAPQPQVPPILLGRNVGLCPALCTMPQALALFPSLLHEHLVPNVGAMQLEGQPVPGVGGWAQLQ